MNVRYTAEADLAALAELEKECFSRPWSVEALAGTMHGDGALFFTAEEDGIPVGYLGSFSAGNEREITNIAVSPAYRRRGIAKALLSALNDAAEKHGEERILLEVRASNRPARTLYETIGFRTDGIRKRYYRDPVEDAILMSFPLNQTDY